jgi:hypothetical protein
MNPPDIQGGFVVPELREQQKMHVSAERLAFALPYQQRGFSGKQSNLFPA